MQDKTRCTSAISVGRGGGRRIRHSRASHSYTWSFKAASDTGEPVPESQKKKKEKKEKRKEKRGGR